MKEIKALLDKELKDLSLACAITSEKELKITGAIGQELITKLESGVCVVDSKNPSLRKRVQEILNPGKLVKEPKQETQSKPPVAGIDAENGEQVVEKPQQEKPKRGRPKKEKPKPTPVDEPPNKNSPEPEAIADIKEAVEEETQTVTPDETETPEPEVAVPEETAIKEELPVVNKHRAAIDELLKLAGGTNDVELLEDTEDCIKFRIADIETIVKGDEVFCENDMVKGKVIKALKIKPVKEQPVKADIITKKEPPVVTEKRVEQPIKTKPVKDQTPIKGFRKAERKKAKLRLGITGPAGSGKTMSALLIAGGLVNRDYTKVGIVDTENGSGDLYVHSNASGVEIGDYNVLTLEPPFESQKYINAIKLAEEAGLEVVILDSITHAWAGQGGLLEKQGKLADKGGNPWTAWRTVTPEHNLFIDAMLQSKIHVIATMRSKTEHVFEAGRVKKVGMAPVARDGMEYEFSVVFDLDQGHNATATKDRTSLFDQKIFRPTEETGKTLLQWLETGV